ncbi:hypothetical protein G5714_009692 [Onychostoma macrolepis]|uniref:histone acetyltransferase n=1 Tax=Onychostoma macrolepis TaxID=369639 RepID=A0A7J6CT57_9TELE|nr:hypothetical protein G5714_009692 [Onychostoma macrolepis]
MSANQKPENFQLSEGASTNPLSLLPESLKSSPWQQHPTMLGVGVGDLRELEPPDSGGDVLKGTGSGSVNERVRECDQCPMMGKPIVEHTLEHIQGKNCHFLYKNSSMEEKRGFFSQGPQQPNTVGPGQAIRPPNGHVPMSCVPNQSMTRMHVPQGLGQFSPVTMQMSPSAVGAPRSASGMTHPPQMGMGTVPAMGMSPSRFPQAPAMMGGLNQTALPGSDGGVYGNQALQSGQTEEKEPEVSSTTPSSQSAQSRKKFFKAEELRQALMQTLEALYRHPESLPFRQPVDPTALGIPDYFDIVKNPIDLSTIKRKLDTGQYQEPWQYVDDIWLMFKNAWLYNRKTSRVYKHCSKLAEVFERVIDPVMQGLGYCCGRKYEFSPQTLCCYGKLLCTISRDATYYSYHDRYHFCEKCFNKIKDTVTLGDDPAQPQTVISKEQFEKKKNDMLDPEPFVECKDCGRKMHQICVLHYGVIWPSGFTCDNCLKKSGKTRKENKFSAKSLQSTRLGSHIEDRVNKFLKRKKHTEAGEVFVRVVASSDKTVEVKPRMKSRRVYISYLDSVHFFKPRELRTAVYHEILSGYLEYVKKLGYVTAHIWACPPREGDDYIFHAHPPDQKIPEPERLQEWYRKMLDKARAESIIHDYKDIFKQATEDRLPSACRLPYFEGDFWPNALEESIKELEQEKKWKKENIASSETTEGTKADSKNAKKNNRKTNKNKRAVSRANKKKPGMPNDDLSQKLYEKMKKHKEVFFVIHLHDGPVINTLPPITDPDPLLTCDLMDSRDAFLTLARDKHWEFSSLRRSKWSTMCMLVELRNQRRSVYTCSECKHHVETRWHCTVCEDFDLCINCYNSKGHEHQMEKWGLGLDDDSNQGSEANKSPQESQRLRIHRYIQALLHACRCRNANCSLPSCQKMKRVMQHIRGCERRINGGCSVCKQLIMLCWYHAKHCQENNCPVPFCLRIKHNIQQQIQQQAHMALMQGRGMPPSLPFPTTSGGPGTPNSQQLQLQQPNTPQTWQALAYQPQQMHLNVAAMVQPFPNQPPTFGSQGKSGPQSLPLPQQQSPLPMPPQQQPQPYLQQQQALKVAKQIEMTKVQQQQRDNRMNVNGMQMNQPRMMSPMQMMAPRGPQMVQNMQPGQWPAGMKGSMQNPQAPPKQQVPPQQMAMAPQQSPVAQMLQQAQMMQMQAVMPPQQAHPQAPQQQGMQQRGLASSIAPGVPQDLLRL